MMTRARGLQIRLDTPPTPHGILVIERNNMIEFALRRGHTAIVMRARGIRHPHPRRHLSRRTIRQRARRRHPIPTMTIRKHPQRQSRISSNRSQQLRDHLRPQRLIGSPQPTRKTPRPQPQPRSCGRRSCGCRDRPGRPNPAPRNQPRHQHSPIPRPSRRPRRRPRCRARRSVRNGHPRIAGYSRVTGRFVGCCCNTIGLGLGLGLRILHDPTRLLGLTGRFSLDRLIGRAGLFGCTGV